jgi:hypothetical protein
VLEKNMTAQKMVGAYEQLYAEILERIKLQLGT